MADAHGPHEPPPETPRSLFRPDRHRPIHPLVERLAAYSWRLIVIAAAVVGVLWLIGQLLLVILPLALATLLTVALTPVVRWLRGRGLSQLGASWVAVLGFLAVLVAIGALVVPALVDEFSGLGDTLTEGVDEIEEWVVEDSPFDVSRADAQEARDDLGSALERAVKGSGETVQRGVVVLGEALAGIVLSLVLTFYLVKDGPQFQQWALRRVPEPRRPEARRVAARAWKTLGGYLRGSATLGAVEGIIIGTAVALAGGSLAVPVAIITFFAAFVPIVGAVTAGVVAVLVTLVTGGVVPALIVAGVALLVQQLDNDLLGPYVFGTALDLHPVVVLVTITAGGALFGFVGAVLAVPTTAVIINSVREMGAVEHEADGGAPSAEAAPADDPGG